MGRLLRVQFLTVIERILNFLKAFYALSKSLGKIPYLGLIIEPVLTLITMILEWLTTVISTLVPCSGLPRPFQLLIEARTTPCECTLCECEVEPCECESADPTVEFLKECQCDTTKFLIRDCRGLVSRIFGFNRGHNIQVLCIASHCLPTRRVEFGLSPTSIEVSHTFVVLQPLASVCVSTTIYRSGYLTTMQVDLLSPFSIPRIVTGCRSGRCEDKSIDRKCSGIPGALENCQ